MLTLLTLSTVGCSNNKDWITSDGTNIYINGKSTLLTEFNGIEGLYDIEGDPINVSYKTCVSEIRDCPENRQGVHEDDLSKYKKAKYFDAYINTFSVMHLPLEEDTTKECTIETQDKDIKPLDSVRDQAYETLNNLKFQNIDSSIFDNKVKINGQGQSLIVRNTDITIPGLLSVMKGTKECNQQVEVNGVTLMKYESNNFDFYQYGDILIKSVKGTDISQYIEFKN